MKDFTEDEAEVGGRESQAKELGGARQPPAAEAGAGVYSAPEPPAGAPLPMLGLWTRGLQSCGRVPCCGFKAIQPMGLCDAAPGHL